MQDSAVPEVLHLRRRVEAGEQRDGFLLAILAGDRACELHAGRKFFFQTLMPPLSE